ncbi:alpha-2-macroglobulin domain-containing protein [Klebsiella oxytoca]|nr:alpha-2-macroglobulin domain-containing protein [Klebsiella oxytoca]
MKPFRLAALSLALLTALSITGCDDSGKPQAAAPAASEAADNAPAKPDSAQLAALAEKSKGKALTLLDASEVQLDGAATLVLTFSIPLQPDQDFSRSVHLVDKKSGKVDGAWELAPNLKELRLRHLEPKRELIVSVDPTLAALNKATFDSSFEKTITTRDIAPSIGFASRGSLLPGKVVAGLPVMALNVDNIDVNFFRIKPESLSASSANGNTGIP